LKETKHHGLLSSSWTGTCEEAAAAAASSRAASHSSGGGGWLYLNKRFFIYMFKLGSFCEAAREEGEGTKRPKKEGLPPPKCTRRGGQAWGPLFFASVVVLKK
jgi:hypothetical protein